MNTATENLPVETEQAMPPARQHQNMGSMIIDTNTMMMAMKMAEIMAKGVSTVPKHLQGNTADCMAVVLQAMQWGMIPHVVAQKTHLVNGQLGYEAQLVNAVVQSSGAIQGNFEYEFKGAKGNYSCRVGAVLKGDAHITWGEWLSEGEVTTKNSPLWKTNPKQQLGYLQLKNWARLYTPAPILGVYTPDELMEIDTTSPKPMRQMGPAEVVAQQAVNAGDTYKAFEDEVLPFLRDAAVDGLVALQAAFAQVPKSTEKEQLWRLHAEALKTAASIADDAAAEEAMMGKPAADASHV